MQRCLKQVLAPIVLAATLLVAATASAQTTIDKIKARGRFNCPVPTGGYVARAELDDKGVWRGLDVDFCRATAAAILGSRDKVNFVPISWAQRFPTLQAGDIDAVITSTGWSLSRETDLKLDFTIPYFLTGLQFMVRKDAGINDPKGLDGGTICITGGTTMELQTAGYMSGNKIKYKPITFEKTEESAQGFFSGRCDAIANTGESLGIMAAQQPNPSLFKIIPEVPVTLEANAMAVRGGDRAMLAVLNYVRTALLEADILGITSQNVEEARTTRSSEPRVAILLGVTPGAGKRLGLPDSWAYDAIKAVGSYDEVFSRYFGEGSRYKMSAGLNAVYTKGGVHYPTTID